MEIKPSYVTFEQAKLLKEKRFDEITDTIFMTNHSSEVIFENINRLKHSDGVNPFVSRPEQWQVVEWLRINYGINVLPIESYTYPDEIKNRWKYQIVNKQEKDRDIFNKKFFIESDYEFQSPQEAYSAAFDYVLKELI